MSDTECSVRRVTTRSQKKSGVEEQNVYKKGPSQFPKDSSQSQISIKGNVDIPIVVTRQIKPSLITYHFYQLTCTWKVEALFSGESSDPK